MAHYTSRRPGGGQAQPTGPPAPPTTSTTTTTTGWATGSSSSVRGAKRSVVATVNRPHPAPPQVRTGESTATTATSESQTLSSSPFKRLKTSHVGQPPNGALALQGAAWPVHPRGNAAAGVRPQVRESKPWKTPQWIAHQGVATPKRRESRRASNYYEGFNFNKSSASNQLLFANTSVDSSRAQQQVHSNAPTSSSRGMQVPLHAKREFGLAAQRSPLSSTNYRPDPILPCIPTPGIRTITSELPAAKEECAYDDQGDGFTLKSLDFRGSQSTDIKQEHLKIEPPETELDPFADEVFALALAQGEEIARKGREESSRSKPSPLQQTSTDASTSVLQQLKVKRSSVASINGITSKQSCKPGQQHQPGNSNEPIVIDDEPKLPFVKESHSENSENYDDDSGWLYEAILAEPDIEKTTDRKRKRDTVQNSSRVEAVAPSTSSPCDSILLVPQTNPLFTGVLTDHSTEMREPDVSESHPEAHDSNAESDDIIFMQALELVENEKRAASTSERESEKLRPNASEGDDILSVNPLASVGLTVPSDVLANSRDTGNNLGGAHQEEIERMRQENYKLAQEKAQVEADTERLKRELIQVQRLLQKSQQESISTAEKSLVNKNKEKQVDETRNVELLARPQELVDDRTDPKLEKKRKRNSVSKIHIERESKTQPFTLAPLSQLTDVHIMHRLLDKEISSHFFSLLGSEIISPRLFQSSVGESSTESSVSGPSLLVRNNSSQSLSESQADYERNEIGEQRRKLNLEMREVVAKVFHERAPLSSMLPAIAGFIALTKNLRTKASCDKVQNGYEMVSIQNSATNSASIQLLFSALSVLHVLVQGSESCRRAILWSERDELDEIEKRKAESNTKIDDHSLLYNTRIDIRLETKRLRDEDKGRQQSTQNISYVNAAQNRTSILQMRRSLESIFLLGAEDIYFHDQSREQVENRDFFNILSRFESGSGLTKDDGDFQLLPANLDTTNTATTTSASQETYHRKDTGTYSLRRHVTAAKIYVPKLIGLLIARVLKRREISVLRHEEIINRTLEILNILAWHCPPHLLHKFEPLFTTNLMFSFLGRASSLATKELVVDILTNLFRNPSYLPVMKKTANNGITLVDRTIKYLGAEQYGSAETIFLRTKIVRLISMIEMKYKDVCMEILHSNEEKAKSLFISLGIALSMEIDTLQHCAAHDEGATRSADLIREIMNLLLLLIHHLGQVVVAGHIAVAMHQYVRAIDLLGSQGVHPLVSDLAASAVHVHALLFQSAARSSSSSSGGGSGQRSAGPEINNK